MKCTTCGVSVVDEGGPPPSICPSCTSPFGGALLEQAGVEMPPAGDRFGRYELIDEIGRGGMGVVFRARDPNLNRDVAVKILKEGAMASKDAVVRFQREAQTSARLRHPNIISVHEVGTERGLHYFTMDYVGGRPLSNHVQEGRFTLRERAAMVRDVALALEHAHRSGVIHRDIKPGNILIEGGTDRALIMDFGLAKDLDAGTMYTADGMMVGTPWYMSPEQVRGDVAAVDGRSDIYGLGVVLYVMLTDDVPHEAHSAAEVFRMILEDEPRPPMKRSSAVPVELQNICLKAMHKEPSRRYQTAAAMAEDLTRWLEGREVGARGAGVGGRLLARIRRRPAVWAACALALVALLALAGVTARQVKAEARRQEAGAAVAEIAARIDAIERDPAGAGAALTRIEEAAAWLPDEARLHSLHGRLLAMCGRRDEAIAAFTRAIAVAPSAQDHYRRGILRGDAGDLTRALELELKNDAQRLHAQAALALAKGDAAAAERTARDALRRRFMEPTDALRDLEPAYWDLAGEPDRADEVRRRDVEAVRRRGVEDYDTFMNAWFGAGVIDPDEWVEGTPNIDLAEQAYVHLTRAIEWNSQDRDSYKWRGFLGQRRARAAARVGQDPRGFAQLGVDDLARALALGSDDPEIYNHRALCHQFIMEYREQYGGDAVAPMNAAVDDLLGALAVKPDNADAATSLGYLLIKRAAALGSDDDRIEAIRVFTIVIEAPRTQYTASAHWGRAMMRLEIHEHEPALYDLRSAVRLDRSYRGRIPEDMWREIEALPDDEF